MKKNSNGLLEVSLEEMKELYGEEGLCTACRCVAAAEDIDHLYVLMVDKTDSGDYDPISISCGKCREALFASFPFVEKAADAGQFVAFPKASVVLSIERCAKSFLKRELNPQERIRITVQEVPADFDAEQEATELQKELDVMKRWPLW
jgi:hypothetical protein